jgi:hypothetical protein
VRNAERCTPQIVDYRIWNDTTDYTATSLQGAKLVIAVNNVDKADRASFARISQLVSQLKDVEAVTFTASDGKAFEVFRHEVQLATPYYFADGKMLKTIMRSDPGIFLLLNGTVRAKWHYNDVPTTDEVGMALR